MKQETVLVTGGAGYVGASLVPKLLDVGYRVRVLDLFIYGDSVFGPDITGSDLQLIKGDIRDRACLREVLVGCDAVVHLACISNDPSFELDPALGRSINFEAFEPLAKLSQEMSVQRFIYASTSSVYGISEAPEVTEEHPLVPLTDYNRYKALCEPILLDLQGADFVPIVVRPATVCGYSPRQRFDLTVNILTSHAVGRGEVTVFGGAQRRPNIHIDDMVDVYTALLQADPQLVAGETFNAGSENRTVLEIANTVRVVVEKEMGLDGELPINVVPSDDIRSYHISSKKLEDQLGFEPKRTVEDAVRDLCDAFRDGMFPGRIDDPRYHNIKRMQEIDLT